MADKYVNEKNVYMRWMIKKVGWFIIENWMGIDKVVELNSITCYKSEIGIEGIRGGSNINIYMFYHRLDTCEGTLFIKWLI